MALPKLSAFEPLEAEHVRELVRGRGPCVSIYLAPYHPGETSPRAQRAPLKDHLHTAAQRLSRMHVDDAAAEALLEPLRAFTATVDADSGFHWTHAIFRGPDLLRAVFIRGNAVSGVFVGEQFQILPALGELQVPAEFFILKLSRRRVSLLRAGLTIETVKLPGKTPETYDEFLEMDRPDHDLENRGSVGGPAGGRRIRFGTENERENVQLHMADFFRNVDRAIRESLRDPKTALVLAGVEEDTALYRAGTTLGNVLPGGVTGTIPDPDLLQQASALLRETYCRRAAQALNEAKETFAPARFLTDPDSILQAASSGRVGKLYIGAPAADEDRFNRAAVDTLRNSGEALLVPRGSTPDHVSMAAILRY